ncbi:hypothetical protein GCM10009663_77640 [Kitasatospora arboriphila]|uniref:Tn3 transposase DDE domain-containing protein n=1 Tax=Kitasatospora arboriphila TaxID=258052 RepID=A0ABN1UAQ6_9ACTN
MRGLRLYPHRCAYLPRPGGASTRSASGVPLPDAGWIGEAGPGPSCLDPGPGGSENDFTNRNAIFMTWNLLHLARMLKDAGSIPAHGNRRSEWGVGCRFDFENPEHRCPRLPSRGERCGCSAGRSPAPATGPAQPPADRFAGFGPACS